MSNPQSENRFAIISEIAAANSKTQVDQTELDMLRRLNDYPECEQALRMIAFAENRLKFLLDDDRLIDTAAAGYIQYAGALARETYVRGMLHGARLFHSLLNEESPRQ